jgi:hypothetical protein
MYGPQCDMGASEENISHAALIKLTVNKKRQHEILKSINPSLHISLSD